MSLLPPKLSRYAAVASLLLKYGRASTGTSPGQDETDEKPEALARLQDNVQSFPFADVQRTVEAELGVRLSKAFSSFEETPLAAASLGQVHRAALRGGKVVAVKVRTD